MHNNHKVHGKTFVVFGGDVELINDVERMLLFAGCNVQAYSSVTKGLGAIGTARPDIILFETSASDADSSEAITALQANKETQDIPLLIIAEPEEVETLRALCTHGQQEYVLRSEFDVMQIVLRIESILERVPTAAQKTMFDFSESDKNVVKSVGEHTLRLLVIEDDLLLQNLLSLRLSKSNIQFQFCRSGLEAIAKITEYRPTIVLLDLMLPGKNGLEVLAELRALPEIAATPVIIFSNKDNDEERAKAASLGVTSFLVKATTDLSTLIDLIIEKGKVQ